jgi:hypothetical protein
VWDSCEKPWNAFHACGFQGPVILYGNWEDVGNPSYPSSGNNQKDQHPISGWNFSSTPQPLGRRRGLKLISMKQDLESFKAGEHFMVQKIEPYSNSTGTEAPMRHFQPSPVHLFIWLFICILYVILYTKALLNKDSERLLLHTGPQQTSGVTHANYSTSPNPKQVIIWALKK